MQRKLAAQRTDAMGQGEEFKFVLLFNVGLSFLFHIENIIFCCFPGSNGSGCALLPGRKKMSFVPEGSIYCWVSDMLDIRNRICNMFLYLWKLFLKPNT